MTTSGFTRRSLGARLAVALDAKAKGGELTWTTGSAEGDRLVYVITPGPMWADPKPPTLFLTPGETAEWLGLAL